MRFADFLRVAVLLFAGAGTALAVVAVAGASAADSYAPLYFALAWWAVAGAAGLWLGRRDAPTAQIGRLLAAARNVATLPEVEPGGIVFNRLWPVALLTVVSGGVGLVAPQVPAVAAGYALAVALTWRKQSRAVIAVEQRDGVVFYVDRGSPFGSPRLVRTPGLRRIEPTDAAPRARAPRE